jgi:hypothetical protein
VIAQKANYFAEARKTIAAGLGVSARLPGVVRATVGQCCKSCTACGECTASRCYCYCDCSGIGSSYCIKNQSGCLQSGCISCVC